MNAVRLLTLNVIALAALIFTGCLEPKSDKKDVSDPGIGVPVGSYPPNVIASTGTETDGYTVTTKRAALVVECPSGVSYIKINGIKGECTDGFANVSIISITETVITVESFSKEGVVIGAIKYNLSKSSAAPYTTATPPGGTYRIYPRVTLSADSENSSSYFCVNEIADANSATANCCMPYEESEYKFSDPVDLGLTGNTNAVICMTYFSVDRLGNVESRKSAIYTIDPDQEQGDLSLGNLPPAVTNTRSISVSVDRGGGPYMSYDFELDGDWHSGHSEAFSRRITASNLSEGFHTLMVWGLNSAGDRVDPVKPAVHRWRVDITRPGAVEVIGPFITGVVEQEFYVIPAQQDSDIYQFIYRIDGGLQFFSDISEPIYAPDDLEDGDHQLEVWGMDLAGNIQEIPTVFSWYLDTSEPPPVFDLDGDTMRHCSFTQSEDITLTFRYADKTSPVTIPVVEYQWKYYYEGIEYEDWSEPESINNNEIYLDMLDYGNHNIVVRTIDQIGNVQSEENAASFVWTVYEDPPDMILNNTPNEYSNNNNILVEPVNQQGVISGACGTYYWDEVSSYYYTLNGSEKALLNINDNINMTNLADGEYELQVWGVNDEGSTLTGVNINYFNIDTVPPDSSALTFGLYPIGGGEMFNSNHCTNDTDFEMDVCIPVSEDENHVGGIPQFVYYVEPDGVGPEFIEFDDENDDSYCVSPGLEETGYADGWHQFSLYAIDRAGNWQQVPLNHNMLVDTAEPTVDIDDADVPGTEDIDGEFLNVTAGYNFNLTIEEANTYPTDASGLQEWRYVLQGYESNGDPSDPARTCPEANVENYPNALTDFSATYLHDFDLGASSNNENEYRICFTARDNVNNWTSPEGLDWTVDQTPPESVFFDTPPEPDVNGTFSSANDDITGEHMETDLDVEPFDENDWEESVLYHYNINTCHKEMCTACGNELTEVVDMDTDLTDDLKGGDNWNHHKVCVWGEDQFGNVQVDPTELDIVIDTTAPDASELNLNYAGDICDENNFCGAYKAGAPLPDLKAENFGDENHNGGVTGWMWRTVTGGDCTDDDEEIDGSDDWEEFTGSIANINLGIVKEAADDTDYDDGEINICFKAKDSADNESTWMWWGDIYFDRVEPVAPTFSGWPAQGDVSTNCNIRLDVDLAGTPDPLPSSGMWGYKYVIDDKADQENFYGTIQYTDPDNTADQEAGIISIAVPECEEGHNYAHKVSILVRDNANNWSTSATLEWVIDMAPPTSLPGYGIPAGTFSESHECCPVACTEDKPASCDQSDPDHASHGYMDSLYGSCDKATTCKRSWIEANCRTFVNVPDNMTCYHPTWNRWLLSYYRQNQDPHTTMDNLNVTNPYGFQIKSVNTEATYVHHQLTPCYDNGCSYTNPFVDDTVDSIRLPVTGEDMNVKIGYGEEIRSLVNKNYPGWFRLSTWLEDAHGNMGEKVWSSRKWHWDPFKFSGDDDGGDDGFINSNACIDVNATGGTDQPCGYIEYDGNRVMYDLGESVPRWGEASWKRVSGAYKGAVGVVVDQGDDGIYFGVHAYGPDGDRHQWSVYFSELLIADGSYQNPAISKFSYGTDLIKSNEDGWISPYWGVVASNTDPAVADGYIKFKAIYDGGTVSTDIDVFNGYNIPGTYPGDYPAIAAGNKVEDTFIQWHFGVVYMGENQQIYFVDVHVNSDGTDYDTDKGKDSKDPVVDPLGGAGCVYNNRFARIAYSQQYSKYFILYSANYGDGCNAYIRTYDPVAEIWGTKASLATVEDHGYYAGDIVIAKPYGSDEEYFVVAYLAPGWVQQGGYVYSKILKYNSSDDTFTSSSNIIAGPTNGDCTTLGGVNWDGNYISITTMSPCGEEDGYVDRYRIYDPEGGSLQFYESLSTTKVLTASGPRRILGLQNIIAMPNTKPWNGLYYDQMFIWREQSIDDSLRSYVKNWRPDASGSGTDCDPQYSYPIPEPSNAIDPPAPTP